MRVFAFEPEDYRDEYAERGWIHVPGGVAPEFHDYLRDYSEREIGGRRVAGEAIGGRKQQALFEFPPEGDSLTELFDAVASVAGLNRPTMTLSERHIKAYDPDAPPDPLPHKDRFASQISLGLSIRSAAESKLVLYPYDELDVNRFNVSATWIRSLPPERRPELALKDARAVEIDDKPGDVMMFRGSAIWHCRRNPANAVNLYLKLNDFECDPLGEDPQTPRRRERTLTAVREGGDGIGHLVPVAARRLDRVVREYERDGRQTIRAQILDASPIDLGPLQLALFEALDGRHRVDDLMGSIADGAGDDELRRSLVELAERGVIDLLNEPTG